MLTTILDQESSPVGSGWIELCPRMNDTNLPCHATAVFRVWQSSYLYVSFLVPSSSEVEAVIDLVPTFLLFSVCNYLLLQKRYTHPLYL